MNPPDFNQRPGKAVMAKVAGVVHHSMTSETGLSGESNDSQETGMKCVHCSVINYMPVSYMKTLLGHLKAVLMC